MAADMAAAGRAQSDIDAVEPLFSDVQKKVLSAILRPTVRTQYQRCAFQIPFDATVRISLDTNLRMYKELPDEENPLWSSDMGLLAPHPPHESHARGTNLSRLSGRGAAAWGPRTNVVNASELSSESGEDSIEFKAWFAAPFKALPCFAAVLCTLRSGRVGSGSGALGLAVDRWRSYFCF